MTTNLLKQLTASIILLFSVVLSAQTDGDLDTSFIGTDFFNFHSVNDIALQSDGKILVAGQFKYSNETGLPDVKGVIRLQTDGSFGFYYYAADFGGLVNSIAIQPDGKFLVGGGTYLHNGTTYNRILRYSDEGIDTSFNIGTGFNKEVSTIAVQPNGKILVGGRFTEYNGQTRNYFVRLDANGNLDTTFIIGVGFNHNVNPEANAFTSAIAIQSDGKILVGGNFTSYQSNPRNRIVRLNEDGSLDTSFNIGTGFDMNPVATIAVQPNGKILVGGGFTSYNGTSQNRIARLNEDGSLDTSFNIGTGFNGGAVSRIALQSDGKILVGGSFTSYNGTPLGRIARLNEDGSLDTSFNIGTGFNGSVRTIALQSDEKILVGGNFTSYNGTDRDRLARLHNSATATIEDIHSSGLKFYPNPVKDILYFEQEVQKATITDLTGKTFATHNNSTQIDMSKLQNGVYLITIEQENGVKETKKVIKQ